MTRMSFVVPHWPIDAEVDEALRRCLRSLPSDAEKIVVVNEGTGFAHNVNKGIGLAGGEWIAVVTNDSRVMTGNVYDLCVPETVTSPVVLQKPGVEPGGFHGAFWVAPREILQRLGGLDEHFEGAFFEDNDLLARLREEGVPTKQIATVVVESARIGLTMSKVPELAARWYEANERRFFEKWGWLPPVTDQELGKPRGVTA